VQNRTNNNREERKRMSTIYSALGSYLDIRDRKNLLREAGRVPDNRHSLSEAIVPKSGLQEFSGEVVFGVDYRQAEVTLDKT
jgi:hypothetical protein